MTPQDDWKYDVAISLLSQDAATGAKLADRLQRAGWEVFFYRERPEETAGPEGIESFRAPFREDTRFSVILFREGWGETEWTAVEAQAIKERQLEDRWRSFQVVRVGPGELPNWVPDEHIYVNFDEFGVEGAAAVIDEHLRRGGAEASSETPAERGARLEREAERRRAGRNFLRSQEGSDAVRSAVDTLFGYLSSQVDAMQAEADVPISFEKGRPRVVAVTLPKASVQLAFTKVTPADKSTLYVHEYLGKARLEGVPLQPPEKINEVQGRVRADEEGSIYFYAKGQPERSYAPQEFGRLLLERTLDRHYQDEGPAP